MAVPTTKKESVHLINFLHNAAETLKKWFVRTFSLGLEMSYLLSKIEMKKHEVEILDFVERI